MAETGVAIAAARAEAVAALAAVTDAAARADPERPFRWSERGALKAPSTRDLASAAAVDVEDAYVAARCATRASAIAAPAARFRGPHRTRPHRQPRPEGDAGRGCAPRVSRRRC